MRIRSIHQYVAIIGISCITIISHAQSGRTSITENKPYKILTSGKQITVKSTKNIKSVMVWTASGHRIVEQKQINNTSFSFTINVNEKVFFLMIEYEGAKPYTEKLGI
jgi:hypothetical protein